MTDDERPDTCVHCGAELHPSEPIGVEIRGVYDGVAAWACPHCGGWWHRFPDGDARRDRVAALLGGCAPWP